LRACSDSQNENRRDCRNRASRTPAAHVLTRVADRRPYDNGRS
jgi:hypothetical protein